MRRNLFWLVGGIVGLCLGGCPQAPLSGDPISNEPTNIQAGDPTDSALAGPPNPSDNAMANDPGTPLDFTDRLGADPATPPEDETPATTDPAPAETSDFERALGSDFPTCVPATRGDQWERRVLELVNIERIAAGAPPVEWSDTLADQATKYACELIHYRFFDHVNPATDSTLSERAAEFRYDFWIIGENLAAGQRSPEEAVEAWMNSPCHRENMLNPAFTELGVGIRLGGEYGYYWVQEFGRPFEDGSYDGPTYHDPECTH